MDLILTNNNNKELSTFNNFGNLLDENRNLSLKNSSAEEFLEFFFKMEIEKRNGTKLSEHTLKAYRDDAKTLFSFLNDYGIHLDEIAFPEVLNYNQFIFSKYAPRTANRKLLFLKRILIFGFKSKYFKENYSLWIENAPITKGHYDQKKETIKQDKREVFLRELEQETALAIAKSFEYICKPIKRNMPYLKYINQRNHLIGFLLYSTGLRASEMINLNFSHVQNKNGNYYLNVLGKGNKLRKVPLTGENTINAFETFKDTTEELIFRKDINRSIDDIPLLYNPIDFITKQSIVRISYSSLYKIVKQGVQTSMDIYKCYMEQEQLDSEKLSIASAIKRNLNQSIKQNKVSPHWFRHSYVTMLLSNDVPLAVVKDLVGHADISTTNIYLEKINEEKKHEHLTDLNLGF